MPRTSRSVAQRLAALQTAKSKKRRPQRPAEAAPAPAAAPAESSTVSVDQILDEIVPSGGGSRAASTPTLTTAASPAGATVSPRTAARKPGTLGRGGTRTATRTPIVRRRYSEYAEEYGYVWADLRRIVIVAGVLIALLIVLEIVLR